MFQKLLKRFRNPFETGLPITGGNIDRVLDGTPGNSAGQLVTESTAMTNSAVWAAVDLISSKIAELPWVYQRREGESWLAAENQPAYNVLLIRTGDMAAQQFLQMMSVNVLLYGNSFAWVRRDRMGRTIELRAIHPVRVQIYRRGVEDNTGPARSVYYQVNPSSTGTIRGPLDEPVPVTIEQRDMLHIRHMAPHGFWGLSPIRWGARSIGKNLSTEDYISEFYVNDATPGGIFTPDKPMQATEYTAFLEEWEGRHRGVGQHHRANVTRVPGKWQATGISHTGTQMTDLLTYNVRDIARIYRVPAHYLSDPSITAYNSNVEEGKRLLRVTLDPWLIAFEKEANVKVPGPRQEGTYRCQFDRTQYTKGETTASDYRTLVEAGILNRDEARERMGYNPIPGGAGQVFLTPVNVAPDGESDSEAEDTGNGNEGAEPGPSDRFAPATNGKSITPLR